jgi:hypothetical protein
MYCWGFSDTTILLTLVIRYPILRRYVQGVAVSNVTIWPAARGTVRVFFCTSQGVFNHLYFLVIYIAAINEKTPATPVKADNGVPSDLRIRVVSHKKPDTKNQIPAVLAPLVLVTIFGSVPLVVPDHPK